MTTAPAPPRRDPVEARARLEAWFAKAMPAATELVIGEPTGPAATGYSHETLLVDARWRDDGVEHAASYVVRIQPTTHTVFLEPDFAAEYRVMNLLAGTEVAVPRVLGFEADPSHLGAPFLVMEHVAGQIPEDNPPYTFEGWLCDASPHEQRSIWLSGVEAMASVHLADPAPFVFVRRAHLGAPGLDEQIAYWRAMLDWVGGPVPAPVAAGFAFIDARRPPQAPLALCWGDARIANQIFRDARCVAVLDWEMAALADPEMDLAWFCYFDRLFSEGLGMPPLRGIPPRADTIAWWEELTGRRALHQGYYEIFAALRFAVIMMRLGQLMVLFGRIPADSDFGTNNFAIDFLARLLDDA